MLTDSRFWIGIGVGVVAAMWVIPAVRGMYASRSNGGG